MDEIKRNFSELPLDILSAIAGKLLTPSDFVWFGAVCVSWRLASLTNSKHLKLPSLLPVLLLSSSSTDDDDKQEDNNQQINDDEDNIEEEDWHLRTDDGEEDNVEENPPPEPTRNTNTNTRSLYSLYDDKVYDWQLRVGGDCRSSSHGWLVVTTEADQNYSVKLVNPFTSVNKDIELPPLTTFHLERGTKLWNSAHLVKAAFSASPSSCSNPKDIVVMAIHGCFRLSFCRPGDKAWTALPDEWNVFQDVIYYNGLFYAILQTGKLFAFEIDPLHSNLKDFKVLIDVPHGESEKKYIVESDGELLQVKRNVDHDGNIFKYKTVYFKVFKLDQTIHTGSSEWVEIKTLNGRSLFLGHNTSISLLASDVPGCKPNCIYFTDDHEDIFLCYPSRCCHHDMGIYNLEDESFVPHYRMQTKTNTPHPIWIQSTL